METAFKVGDIVEAEITRITDFGAFVKIEGKSLGLIHISQISNEFVKDIKRYLKVGDQVKGRVIKLGPGKKIDLSLKKPASRFSRDNSRHGGQARLPREKPGGQAGFKSSDLEEKLKKFVQESQKSLAD